MNWLSPESNSPGSFRLCKAVHLPTYAREKDDIRCDSYGWGPVSINWIPEGDLFGTSSLPSINSLHDFNIVVDAAPYFYITYNQFIDISTATPFGSLDISQEAWMEHPETVAPTLPHLFRSMIEWDYVFHEPFNNMEESAELSHKALSILGMTNEIRNSFIEHYPDMPIAKYLNGNTNAKDLPGSGNLTSDLENYLNNILENFKYRSYLEADWVKTVETNNFIHESFS